MNRHPILTILLPVLLDSQLYLQLILASNPLPKLAVYVAGSHARSAS